MVLYLPATNGSLGVPSVDECAHSGQLGRDGRLADLTSDVRLVGLDVLIVVAAYATALGIRYDGQVPAWAGRGLLVALPLAVLCYLGAHVRHRMYGRVWLHAGPDEAWHEVMACLTATGLLTTADVVYRALPLSVPLNAGALVLLGTGAVRFRSRIWAQHDRPALTGSQVLLIGPLAAARTVVSQMYAEPAAGLRPVGVLTDDPSAWGRYLNGVPVSGPVADLGAAARNRGAEQVLLLPGALTGVRVRELAEAAQRADVRLRALPTLLESVDRPPRLRDIRDLSLEDLLGRDQVEVDCQAVRAIVSGHRVLITGAGGSVGSEIAAQVSRLGPESLILLDHDETHLHDALSYVTGPARCVLGDIRDGAFLDRLFLETRPEVVFHAAAHKHVPILEEFPSEAVRTNVAGTEAVLGAALRAGTARFVAISTDKAVSPTCVMGASKRLAEQLVVRCDGAGLHFCAVRFGNVLGSRGSVVPTFFRQVESGGPVTVTHPDVTRFFMTTREAVALVMQAAATASGGEVFMLDMGEPIRIVDLAEGIIRRAGLMPGRDIAIEFVGLRPGEKLHEQLSSPQESVYPTEHPKVCHVHSEHYDPHLLGVGVDELVRRAESGDEQGTRALLLELARMPDHVTLDGEVAAILRAHPRLAAVTTL